MKASAKTAAQAGTTCVPDPAVIAAPKSHRGCGDTVNPVTAALVGPQSVAHAKYCAPRRSQRIWPILHDTAARTATISRPPPRFFNRVDSLIGKIDHNFNPNNMLTGRYYFGDSNQSFPFAQLAGGLLPGFNTVTPTRVQLISLS